MTYRTLLGRLCSPAGFGLVLIFFLLPFATVSCASPTDTVTVTVTVTGADLVLAGPPDVAITAAADRDPAVEQELAGLIGDEMDLEPLALLAALTVLGGMGVGVLGRPLLRHGLAGGLALTAGAFLVGAMLRIPGHVARFLARINDGTVLPVAAAPVTTARYGYWLALAALAALAVGHAAALVWAARRSTPRP